MPFSRHTCRICNTEDIHPTFVGREMMFGTRENFEYFQCKSCNCLQITEIPNDLSKFYPKNYYSLNKQPPDHYSTLRSFLLKQRFRNALFGIGYKVNKIISYFVDIPTLRVDNVLPITTFLKKANIKNFSTRFLDVGCGQNSTWLNNLHQIGFKNVVGVDPFIEADTNHNGVKIYKRQINEMSGRFDFISFHHSLEHIPDQIYTLKSASELLSEDGVIIIRIPIVSSYAWRHYGVDWVEMDPPRHLYLHSCESIKIAGKKAGLILYDTIYDSLNLEFYGSEQYKRDIPLTASNSYWINRDHQIFTKEDMENYNNLADVVNKNNDGGRASFFFKKSS